MSKLAEKFKNIFVRKKQEGLESSKKDGEFNAAIQGASEIARSIRESEKFKLSKKLWRNIFH